MFYIKLSKTVLTDAVKYDIMSAEARQIMHRAGNVTVDFASL